MKRIKALTKSGKGEWKMKHLRGGLLPANLRLKPLRKGYDMQPSSGKETFRGLPTQMNCRSSLLWSGEKLVGLCRPKLNWGPPRWTQPHPHTLNERRLHRKQQAKRERVPFSWSALAVFFQQLILTKPNIELSGLPWLLSDEEPACQFRRRGFDPWVRKIPWRRKWQPIPVFLPKKFHGQSGLVNYSPWGCKRVRYDLAVSTT